MFLIRHVTQDKAGNNLASGYMATGAKDQAEAEKLVAKEQRRFSHSGYDAEHARWWARNDNDDLIHYWWTEVPGQPAT